MYDLLAINPDFGEDLFTDILPILFYLILFVSLITLGRLALKGDYKNFTTGLIMCSIVLIISRKTDYLLNLGDFLILNLGEIFSNIIL